MNILRIFAFFIIIIIILLVVYFEHQNNKIQAGSKVASYDTTLANDFFAKSEKFRNQAKFDSCIYFYKKASIEYENLKNYKKSILSLYNLGTVYHYYMDNDSIAFHYYQTAYNRCLEKLGKNSILEAQSYYRIAEFYKAYDGNLNIISHRDSLSNIFSNKSISILENYTTTSKKELADKNYYLGLNFSLNNKYKDAYNCFIKAQKQYADLYGNNSKQVAFCLKQIGWTLSYMGKYDETLEYAQECLLILSEIYNKVHPEWAYIYNLLKYIYKNDIEKSIIYAQRSVPIFHNSHMENHVAELYVTIGNDYLKLQNFKKSIEYYKKALSIFKENNKINAISDCYSSLGSVLYMSGYYNDAKKKFTKAMNLKKRLFKKGSIEFLHLYYWLIGYYSFIGDYKNANDYISKLLRLPLKIDNNAHRFYKLVTLLKMSDIYSLKGDYENASNFILEAKFIIKNQYQDSLSNDLNYVYFTSVGFYYYKIGKINKSIAFYNKAILLNDNLKPYFYGGLIINLIEAYNKKGVHKKVLETIDQFYEYPKSSIMNPSVFIEINISYARALIALGRIIEAEKYLNKGLFQCQNTYDKKNILLSQYYLELGKIYSQKKQFKKALFYYQNAIQSVVYDFDVDQIEINPSINNVLSDIDLLKALVQKSKTFREYYEKVSGNINDLIISFNTYELVLELITNIKNSYKSESAKYQFGELNLNIYQDAINIAAKLYKLTQEKIYKEKAFLISEKNKVNVLRQMLTETKAKKFAGIPDSLLEKERYIKKECGFYDYLIYEENNKGNTADTVKLNLWQNELLNLKKQYDALVNHFGKNYPDYYKLKVQFNTISINNLQEEIINDSTLIIEYFMGKKHLYIFSITKDSSNLVQMDIDSLLHQKIKSLRLSIVNRDRNNYSRLAYELYEILINPVKDINTIKKIIIIPDGILGYIPFEVLLTKKIEDKNSDYKNYPYLIKDYQISYSYSATLLIENNKIKVQQKDLDFVGFAPVNFK